MAFQLIPFPISIIFVLVFGMAWIVVLWKLRRTGKIYYIIFKVNIIVGVILIIAFLYEIMTNIH
jgi:4-hydroxybenzoate polyprenyltransferase